MATKQDERSFLDGVTSPSILVALAGLIVYQGFLLRSEIRGLRTEFHAEFRGLRAEFRGEFSDLRGEGGDLSETVHRLEVAVARLEARDSIRLVLAERFSATGEGASYGGPVIAADILLARALSEIDAALSTLDKDAQIELAEDLWEDRANILARAGPTP